ncbi:hypothetical protein AB1L42_01415 [Thalassoglobus sp. JC818]|uniref:type III secretion apparatus assembly protein SctX n=1 Tax=Thalassoglobus sp. JC818 TaxID=3232136 RepID=UPI0034574DDC
MTDVTPKMDFDVGVVRISTHQESHAAHSPTIADLLTPSRTTYALQLEEVLYLPESQEQQLLSALTPQITHTELMKPLVFNSMIGQEIEEFQRATRESKSPSERRTRRKALKTLENLQSLKQTLTRYQHALHRG